MLKEFKKIVPKATQQTLTLWTFGLAKIPLLFFLRPKVVHVGDDYAEIVLPLTRRSKNHLNSMYFGALAAGADLAGGIMLIFWSQSKKLPISMVFKDFHADFLKRAEADVHFICRQGPQIKDLVDKALASGERENLVVDVDAACPSLSQDPVAKFKLTLSIKKRSS